MMQRNTDKGELASAKSPPNTAQQLVPLNIMILLGFMTVGLPLPVLPLFGADVFTANPVLIGVIVGIQSITTVLSRPFAGGFTDKRGAKATTIFGLWLCVGAGVLYVLSCFLPFGLAVLLLGRATLGLGESLILTGAITWGIGRVGAEHSGQVMSWNGIAMYGALAAAAPIGLFVYQSFGQGIPGFAALGATTSLLPAVALVLAYRSDPVQIVATVEQIRTGPILKIIWPFGLSLTLLMATYGIMTSFYSLLFEKESWDGAAIGFFVFGLTVIATRILFGKTPDRLGGRTVAIWSMIAAFMGQGLILIAPNPAVAILGAGVTGAGVALGFPALGIEAMRRVPASNRGMLVAIFSAFQDLAFGASGLVAGLLLYTFHSGPQSAFALGCATASFAILIMLYKRDGDKANS